MSIRITTRAKISMIFAVLPLASFVMCGCSDEKPGIVTPDQPQAEKSVSAANSEKQHTVQKITPSINLSKLWNASKKQVTRTLRGYKLTDQDHTEKDNPDTVIAGGENRTYALGGGTDLNVSFNTRGRAMIVAVDNQENSDGLGFTREHWTDIFHKYGLPDCGEPAVTALRAYRWGPPHNHTGGFEIILVTDENEHVWQVQVRSPDQVYP